MIPSFQLHLPSELRLKWRRLADMPRAMQLPQSVVIHANMYVRGGIGDIYSYDPQTQQWTKVPEYHCSGFTMTKLNDQLVLVGGYDVSTGKVDKTVGVYSASQRSWKQPYPPMNTPRVLPAVSTYHQRLVVAGGSYGGTDLATVEILDTSVGHSQWLFATPLPMRCRLMSTAIIHSTLYLLGGSLHKQVLSVSLPALTQTDKPSAQWCTLPDAPLEHSTVIAIRGFLLAVGGSRGSEHSSDIHVYQQEKNIWAKVGHLPTEREDCACCLLPSWEILVAGGLDKDGHGTSRVDVATVLD